MRIGIIGQRQPPAVGGGYSFQKAVLECIARGPSTSHELIPLTVPLNDVRTEKLDIQDSRVVPTDICELLPALSTHLSRTELVELAVRRLSLDAVWYLDPIADVLSVPVFATVFDLAHREYPYMPEFSTEGWTWREREEHYKNTLPRAAIIFTGTQVGKTNISNIYGISKGNIIVNPLPVVKLASYDDLLLEKEALSRLGIENDYLFYPAQFWPHKNHANLLYALEILGSRYDIFPYLVLTGADKGNLDYVKSLADKLNVTSRVSFVGFVSEEEIVSLYRNAIALVYLSILGPDNLPPLEAFSLGCPVIASRIEGSEEQMGANAALLVDPTSPEKVADAIATLITSNSHRRSLVRHGFELAAQRSTERYVENALSAFDSFELTSRMWSRPELPIDAPSEIVFPSCSQHDPLMLSGFYQDGWTESEARMIIRCSEHSRHLVISGEALLASIASNAQMSIHINGQLLAKLDFSMIPPRFEFAFPISLVSGWHQLKLTFDQVYALPSPDSRVVGARILYIGLRCGVNGATIEGGSGY